ncbi:hypothetical protein [Pseudomonas sp. 2FG]|uniref:hypothetical protein n=1 Tax=Pseudomonas sp. 2FG TaxID=2502191 RepID=UPI0010F7CCAA|nr:hypothetical protein [Pseudomonas sp. 2FG]
MSRHCLICDSIAVLPKDAALGIALLIGVLDGVLHGIRQPGMPTPTTDSGPGSALGELFEATLCGAAGALAGNQVGLLVSQDVAKFWFGSHNCLCLRCGATFNEQPEERSSGDTG